MVDGLWSGFKLFGKTDYETFRKTASMLVLLAGLPVIAPVLASALRRFNSSG